METSVNVREENARSRALRSAKNRGRVRQKRTTSDSGGRRRFSISLSPKAAEAFEWLKEVTDADTDSEVIRNALRLHFVLLQGAKEGCSFFQSPSNAPEQLTKIELFVIK